GVKDLQDNLCITNPHYNNLRVPSLSFNVISHLVFTFSAFNYLHHLHYSTTQPHIHFNLSCMAHNYASPALYI
ncbi:hypothetical protein CLU79DRAFT_728698, partial [Phycomyces nitens]